MKDYATAMLVTCPDPGCNEQFSDEHILCPACGRLASAAPRKGSAISQSRSRRIAVLKKNRSGQLTCNKCSHTEFTRLKPAGWVEFANDYVCTKCGTRFSAPTPFWAAVLFMMLGLPLTCLGLFWIYANLESANEIAIGIGAVILFFGIGAFCKGAKSL